MTEKAVMLELPNDYQGNPDDLIVVHVGPNKTTKPFGVLVQTLRPRMILCELETSRLYPEPLVDGPPPQEPEPAPVNPEGPLSERAQAVYEQLLGFKGSGVTPYIRYQVDDPAIAELEKARLVDVIHRDGFDEVCLPLYYLPSNEDRTVKVEIRPDGELILMAGFFERGGYTHYTPIRFSTFSDTLTCMEDLERIVTDRIEP